METVENNQVEELRQEAELLGITVHPNAKAETIAKKIEDKKLEIEEKQQENKAVKKSRGNKVKIIVNPRDNDDNVTDQFFGLNGETILMQFDEEVEVSELMYNHIKNIGGYVKTAKLVGDKKEWTKKWQSRFLVEKVD